MTFASYLERRYTGRASDDAMCLEVFDEGISCTKVVDWQTGRGILPFVENGRGARASVSDVHRVLGSLPEDP